MLDATVVALNLVIILSNKESCNTFSVIEFIIYKAALVITLTLYFSSCNLRLNGHIRLCAVSK
jgi:hypothetical protein